MSENTDKQEAFIDIRRALDYARNANASELFFTGRFASLNLAFDLRSRYARVSKVLEALTDEVVACMSFTHVSELNELCRAFINAIDEMHDLTAETIGEYAKIVHDRIRDLKKSCDDIIAFGVILAVYQIMTTDETMNSNLLSDIAKGGDSLKDEFKTLESKLNAKLLELDALKEEIDSYTGTISSLFSDQTTRNKKIQKNALRACVIIYFVLAVMLCVYYRDLNECAWQNTSYVIGLSVHKALTIGILVTATYAAFKLFKIATHNIEVNEHRVALFAALRAAMSVAGSANDKIVMEKFIDQIVVQEGYRDDKEKVDGILLDKVLSLLSTFNRT